MVRFGAVDKVSRKIAMAGLIKQPTYFLFCILMAVMFCVIPYSCDAASRKAKLPHRARAVLYKAALLMNEKDYDKAIEVLSDFEALGKGLKAGDFDPGGYHHARIYFTLGTCHMFKGEYRRAVEVLNRAVLKNPAHVSSWLNLAKARYELGEFVRAADCFENAYDRASEKNPKHLYYAATTLLMAKEGNASIDMFQKLFGAHPDAIQSEWREIYVQALLSADRAEQAIPHLRDLAENASNDKRVRWQEILLNQYMRLGRWKDAGEYAGSLTEQAPGRSAWWKALAHIYLKEGAYRDALASLTIREYLSPLSEREEKLVADLYLQLGIPAKAAPIYEATLVESNDNGMLQRLITALRQLGRPEEALAALTRYGKDDGGNDLLMVKADLLYELKRYKEAGDAYRAVAESRNREEPAAGRAWLMAGYAALKNENIDTCRNAFKRAAGFASQRKAALSAIKQLDNIARKTAGGKSSNRTKGSSG